MCAGLPLAAAICLALTTRCPLVMAQQPAVQRAPFVEVRLAMSAAAAERFAQQRFRRLLAIELEDTGHLAPQSTGPLGDQVAFVWVDLPKPDQVSIQVRAANRSAVQRILTIANMRGDVAERLVALATAEMVRTQSRPERPRKTTCPKDNGSHDDLPAETRWGIAWVGEGAAAWLPSSSTWIAGPGGSVGYLTGPLEQHMFLRWEMGDASGHPLRWIEAGLSARRLVLSRAAWRLALGASASAAAVRIANAPDADGATGAADGWTGRLSGRMIAEGRLARSAWLGVALEPGWLLRSVHFAPQSDLPRTIGGAWLGLALSLSVEHGLQQDGMHAR